MLTLIISRMTKREMSWGEHAVGKTNALSSIVRIMMSQVLTLIMMKKMTTMMKNIKVNLQ